jgi:hypothetical protein
MIRNKWFNLSIYNPLKTWWKVHKYFKRPKVSISFFSDVRQNCPFASYRYVAKILNILSYDISWKDKYDSPRHEISPYIWVCFFGIFGFSIHFKFSKEYLKEMIYWESILNFIYYDKYLNEAFEVWEDLEGNKTDIKTISLTKYGQLSVGCKYKRCTVESK